MPSFQTTEPVIQWMIVALKGVRLCECWTKAPWVRVHLKVSSTSRCLKTQNISLNCSAVKRLVQQDRTNLNKHTSVCSSVSLYFNKIQITVQSLWSIGEKKQQKNPPKPQHSTPEVCMKCEQVNIKNTFLTHIDLWVLSFLHTVPHLFLHGTQYDFLHKYKSRFITLFLKCCDAV